MTTAWTPIDFRIETTPVPTATATTAVGTGGPETSGSTVSPSSPLTQSCFVLARMSETFEFLEQIGDPDLVGPAHVDAALDGGADVVAVDVAVEDAVAADDDDRVTDLGPRGLETGDRVVGRVEQEHHLVAQIGDRLLVRRIRRRSRTRHR